MPRYISTYSKKRPVLKGVENDAFSVLQQKVCKQQSGSRALGLILEDEIDFQVKEITPGTNSRAWTRNPKKNAVSSTRRPTPLKIEGRKIQRATYSSLVTSHIAREEEDDESILYLTDSSEERSSLCDEDGTMANINTSADISTQYSDIEVARDLPDTKKSKSEPSEILKLSSLHPIKSKSELKDNVKASRPANSTLLEGKFSSMNIDKYGISDISGDGGEFLASDFSPSLLGKKLSLGSSPRVKRCNSRLVSVHKENGNKSVKTTLPMQSTCHQARSVYSLNSSEDTTLPSPPSTHLGKPSLTVTGKKVGLVKKTSSGSTLIKQCSNESAKQAGRKQVSFILGTKPDALKPSDPSIPAPSPFTLPNLSPSSSILKKKGTNNVPVQSNKATSTPQKTNRNGRKTQGCHIMDLSFDISAVSLPSDNDLVIPPDQENKENMDTNQMGATQSRMVETEQLLDFEPLCLEASENLGSCLESTQEKGVGVQERGEVTPSTQIKRRSPDADKPATQLAKKAKSQCRAAWSHNRRRLEYQEPKPSDVPECVITKAPFTGYREVLQTSHPETVQVNKELTDPCRHGPMGGKHPKDFPPDVLETIPESVFTHLSLAIGCST